MKHLILTRLALGEPTVEWLKHRIYFFENFCAPSIQIQTCKNFEWFLAAHIDTPKWFVNRVKKASPFAKILYTNSKKMAIDWTSLIPNESIDNILLTTRLDNDDMLHMDFVYETQQVATEQKFTCALDAPLGYNLEQTTLNCYQQYSESNHFLSLLEFGTYETIYCKQHNSIVEKFKIIQFCTQKHLWVEGVNGNNLVNTHKLRNNKKINWNDVEKNFLPT